MKELYMVVSSGIKDGQAYSTLSRVVQGTSKNGNKYAFLADEHPLRESEEMVLGSVIAYETIRATATK